MDWKLNSELTSWVFQLSDARMDCNPLSFPARFYHRSFCSVLMRMYNDRLFYTLAYLHRIFQVRATVTAVQNTVIISVEFRHAFDTPDKIYVLPSWVCIGARHSVDRRLRIRSNKTIRPFHIHNTCVNITRRS